MKAGAAVAGLALAVLLVLAGSGLVGCPDRTPGDTIDDALDNRPAEKLQDGAEDMKDRVKDATN